MGCGRNREAACGSFELLATETVRKPAAEACGHFDIESLNETGNRVIRRMTLGSIRLYQCAVSPYLPPACRYDPSCSSYAYEAIAKHGLRKGIWMATKRLGRCRPFGARGYDPVP